jgi:hypothetical protein
MKHGDLVKLTRILGMLGSDHAGERAAAALAAHRHVKALGTSWWGLLNGAKEPRPSENKRLQQELERLKGRLAARAEQERRARS